MSLISASLSDRYITNSPPSGGKRGLSTATRVVVLTAFYFVGGLLGKSSSFMSGNVALVWPPAGIALAAILLFGYRFWPGVAAGAVLFTLMNGTPVGFFTVATAVGNTIGAIVCAYLLEQFIRFRPPMERVRDVSGFILLACLLGTTVNAMFNVVGLVYAGQVAWDDLFSNVLAWWIPNAMGALVITPFILSWGSPSSIKWRKGLVIEALFCMAGLAIGTQISFNTWFVHGLESYPLAYLPYPFLAWSALRFGQRGATTGTLVVSAIAIFELLHQRGPFFAGTERTSLMLIGCYIGILAVTNLLLAATATEREQAMISSTSSERRYRAIVEDQTDLICRFNTKGTLTFVNGAYCRFYGKKSSQLVGTSFLPTLSIEDRGIPLAYFLALTPDEPSVELDEKLVSAIGNLTWHQCTVRALFNDHKEIVEFQAVIQDISRRKLSEQAARLGEERLRAIMDSMVDGVILVEENGSITLANPAAELVFQRRSSELIGHPIKNLFEQPDLYDDYLVNHLSSGQANVVEMGALRPNKAALPIDMAISEIRQDGFHLLLVIVRDISERKKMEEQFRQSQKMEAVGRLAGGIAHDFNNLMQALLGYANILQQRLGVADPNRESVEQIQKTIDRARSLTQQLLAFSRKQVMAPQVLRLNTIVFDMSRLIQRLIGEVICLEIKPVLSNPCVRADRGQLEQVLLNLCVNARDAMPKGGHLVIKTETVTVGKQRGGAPAELPAGDYALLSISDTGCGMTADVMRRIFEPFFTTKEAGKGTGLGLSIVYNIVKNCGGAISLNSKPGRGTTFLIYLPQVAPEQVECVTPQTVLPNTRGQETVLLVEDEDLVLLMLTELLKAEGYTVLTASNGAQGLDVAAHHAGSIDLLVTDMSMPEVSGWELSTRLEEAGRPLPVLYMSGYTDDEASQRGTLHNCAGFLQKPFQPSVLLVKVRQILDVRKTPGSQR